MNFNTYETTILFVLICIAILLLVIHALAKHLTQTLRKHFGKHVEQRATIPSIK